MTTTSSATATPTPTPSATQNLVASLGSGSGIDMQALATNLANAQFASQIDRLKNKSDTLTTQVSSASNIKSMLLSFSTSLGDMVRNGSLSPQPQFSTSGIATGTLSGSRQPSGNYSLEVMALAKSQTLASAAYTGSTAMTDAVGPGTLTFKFGTTTPASTDGNGDPVAAGFAEDSSHAAASITIAEGATLSDVANAINAKNAGITAYVAQTSAGAQLVFKGLEGAANGFVIEISSDSSAALSKLAWKPSDTTGQLVTSSGDASFKVDGLARTSGSNTISEAIPGVTLKLAATNVDKPTTVTFSDTSSALSTTMTDLTNALNEIASALNAATDPKTGDLRSDSGARALKSALSQFAGSTVVPGATGAARTLADLGLSTQRDGTFTLDSNRLKATLARDPQGVAAMFTNGLYGVYSNVDKLYRNSTSASNPGSLGGSIARFNKQLTQAKEDQNTLSTKQEKLRATLNARFAVTDSRISSSKSTLSFLQGQIDAWNKSDR